MAAHYDLARTFFAECAKFGSKAVPVFRSIAASGWTASLLPEREVIPDDCDAGARESLIDCDQQWGLAI
jgi:hypothetical protein